MVNVAFLLVLAAICPIGPEGLEIHSAAEKELSPFISIHIPAHSGQVGQLSMVISIFSPGRISIMGPLVSKTLEPPVLAQFRPVKAAVVPEEFLNVTPAK
jgi:hypothetical protein